MTHAIETHDGLEGITVAKTELSHVDGEAGALVLRGYDVERLAQAATFEDICHLLWHGRLPAATEKHAVLARLYAGRERAFALLSAIGDALDRRDAMDALRAAVAHLDEARCADLPGLLVGAVAVFAAAHHRIGRGELPVAPNASHTHAEDYLAMLEDARPSAERVRALDSYLVAIADHGMNASTFAARVVASTGSDAVSAVVAAIGALKGPLHGGAPGPVLDMLDAIGTPEHADAWLRRELARGRRIMGMGHRVYRVRDPRAAVLERALQRLANHARDGGRLALARAVEASATALLDAEHPERKLRANVEFFTAVLLEAVGVERRLFTATFAVGRVAGWCAHVAEQLATGRLIRPASRYVGPMPA